MFDPTKPNDILKLEDLDLSEFLPSAEDDRHEYKSSAIKNDKELGDKIAKATPATNNVCCRSRWKRSA